MKMKKERIFCLGLTAFLLFVLSATSYAQCIIITNNSVRESSISEEDVSRIFLGKKKKWTDGSKIDPVVIKDGDLHEEFLKAFVHKTLASFSSYWKRQIVSGTGFPPKSFSSEPEIVKYVLENPGTIGYISATTAHEGVKVLTIR